MGQTHRREQSSSLIPASPAPSRALADFLAFVKERRTSNSVPKDFAAFERDLHSRVMALEREVLAEEFAQADVTADAIEVGGTVYRRVVRCEDTYVTAAGPVRVERSLYKDRTREDEHSICPMELRLGIIEARWTPLAAELATWVVSQLTPASAAELFARVGNMTPSKSSLDRLPKQLLRVTEVDREAFEAALRKDELVPENTAVVAVSLDGVLAPMKDGERQDKRADAAAAGKLTKGPAGYREVGCGTISMYDADGDLLRVVRMARMPEEKKATLKAMLQAELSAVFKQRPALRLVKLADGAKDNWTFLSGALPAGDEILDFYHAAEHLSAAMGAAYGEGTIGARHQFELKRHVLRHDDNGAEAVIRSLAYLARKHPGAAKIRTVLEYFRNNRGRMLYAKAAAENLPIGSGVVEAACKTLVAQRLKLSGMRWSNDGGQAILNLRAWQQSDRFDSAWALMAAQYKAEVTTIANVIQLHR